MKRRIMAMMLSTILAFGTVCAYGADTTVTSETAPVVDQSQQEEPTEAPTEKPTEATTEAPTEKPTEATTEKPTEATTSAATTTTKSDNNSSNNNNSSSDVSESFDISLDVDDSENLAAKLPSGVTFNWDSDEPSIAAVSKEGRVRGVKNGSCTVTATGKSGNTNYKYTFHISVTKEKETTKNITIKVDGTKDLYNYVNKKFNEKDYTWKSSNEKYVTVSSRGVATGEKKGSATVTAEHKDGDTKYYYEFKITVSNSDDDDDKKSSSSSSSSSSKVSKKLDWTIYVGTDDEVDISGLLEDDPQDYDWDIKDDDIIDFDEKTGEIEGLEEGSTKLYAEGDDDYTFTVKVNDDYSTEEISLKGGATKDLEDVLDEDADEYTYSCDRTAVAKVSNKGVVTGVAKGYATVVCKHEDGDIVQVFVNVTSGGTTTTTTKETTTETTTSAPTTKKAVQNTTVQAVAFNDISDRPWAIDAINAMASKGIIKGIGNNKFSPDTNCKRCDFAIVLINILGLDKEIAVSNYADVKLGEYYYNYVGVAKGKNIECGVSDDSYRPNDFITREEIMVMTYKGLVSQGKTFNTDTAVLNKFTDAADIAPENKEAVAGLINSGMVSGTSDTTLETKANITRAQMAVLMNKVDESK